MGKVISRRCCLQGLGATAVLTLMGASSPRISKKEKGEHLTAGDIYFYDATRLPSSELEGILNNVVDNYERENIHFTNAKVVSTFPESLKGLDMLFIVSDDDELDSPGRFALYDFVNIKPYSILKKSTNFPYTLLEAHTHLGYLCPTHEEVQYWVEEKGIPRKKILSSVGTHEAGHGFGVLHFGSGSCKKHETYYMSTFPSSYRFHPKHVDKMKEFIKKVNEKKKEMTSREQYDQYIKTLRREFFERTPILPC